MSLQTSAAILQPDREGLEQAGKLIREGRCVAFPTETVYGLGANALDTAAVLNIFKFKGRPLSDPLMVHVCGVEDALNLVQLSPQGEALFRALAAAFWPGPLTIVAKAHAMIPLEITAFTGFVGVREPSHPIARSLITTVRAVSSSPRILLDEILRPSDRILNVDMMVCVRMWKNLLMQRKRCRSGVLRVQWRAAQAGVPIAAPSANRFCHVSPTTCAHVLADLGSCPISIINGEAGEHPPCDIGIESTVVKIDPDDRTVREHAYAK